MNQTRSRTLVGAAAAVALVVVGIIAWRTMANRTPSPDAPAEKVRQFVASDQFRNLPQEEKKRYADAVQQNLRPGPDQERMFRNLAETRIQEQLDEYFALPEGKARQDFLDEHIDRQEEIRKKMEAVESGKDTSGRVVIRRDGSTAAAQKQMAETIPAEFQTKLAQFRRDLEQRRAERGLPPGNMGGGIAIRVNQG